jgi:hypothetical protein
MKVVSSNNYLVIGYHVKFKMAQNVKQKIDTNGTQKCTMWNIKHIDLIKDGGKIIPLEGDHEEHRIV